MRTLRHGLTRYAASGGESGPARGHSGWLAGHARYGSDHLLFARPPSICTALRASVRRGFTRALQVVISAVTLAEVMSGPLRDGNEILAGQYREVLTRSPGWQIVTGGRGDRRPGSKIARALPTTSSRCDTGRHRDSQPFLCADHTRFGAGEDFGYPGTRGGVAATKTMKKDSKRLTIHKQEIKRLLA